MAEAATAPRAAAGRRPGALPLLWRQWRAQNKLFWRNPFSAFFTLAFPLMFLLIFNALNTNQRITQLGDIRFAQFFTPGILVFAVVSACYVNMATSVPINRDEGVLKRVRGTPLPAWIYLTARVATAVYMAFIGATLMMLVGVLAFQVKIFWHLLPAAVVTMLFGTTCLCALGLAMATIVPNGEAAPAFANFTWLPIAFVSDIFYPTNNAPTWVKTAGDIFPVKHFAIAMEAAFSPFTKGSGFEWNHLRVIAIWGIAAAIFAFRRFKWEPNVGGSGRRVGASARYRSG
ncbi:MAG TPA: ABC transporter permease [Actinomycetota bacterium]